MLNHTSRVLEQQTPVPIWSTRLPPVPRIIGYSGSDGGCVGRRYSNVSLNILTGNAVVSLRKVDGCTCGCDALSWVGIAPLTNGTWHVVVRTKLAEAECSYPITYCKVISSGGRLAIISLRDLLSSTGCSGARKHRDQHIIINTPRCWDRRCDTSMELVKYEPYCQNPLAIELQGPSVSFMDLVGKWFTYNITISVKGNIVKILNATVCVEGIGCWKTEQANINASIPKPWLVVKSRTGYCIDAQMMKYVVRVEPIKIDRG